MKVWDTRNNGKQLNQYNILLKFLKAFPNNDKN